MIFNVDITERVAKFQLGEHDRLICGNSGDQIRFTFDSEWEAHTTKTARFVWGKKHFDVEFVGDTCDIPVVTNATTLLVGVYAGEDGADEDCIASTNARIPCVLSSRCGDHEANGGTGANYTNEARGYAAEAKAAKETAIECSESAKASAENAAFAVKDATYDGYYWAMKSVSDLEVTDKLAVTPYGETTLKLSDYPTTTKKFVIAPTVETIAKKDGSEYDPNGWYLGPQKLSALTIPRSVKVIEMYGLSTAVGSDQPPFDPSNIGDYTPGSKGLLKILGGVTEIKAAALFGCCGITIDLTEYGENIPFPSLGGTIDSEPFAMQECVRAVTVIKVPTGRKAELASMTNWAYYTDQIVEV